MLILSDSINTKELSEQSEIIEILHRIEEQMGLSPKGVPGKSLLRFAGVIDSNNISEMKSAIEQNCGRINRDEW